MTYGVNSILAACSGHGYDPEWWVTEHVGRCHKSCPHGLAAHICLNHCPVLKECQEMAAMNPDQWAGMVIGGLIWDSRPSQRGFHAPPLRLSCEACQPALVS